MILYTLVLGEDHAESIVFLPGFTGSHDVWNRDFQALSRCYKLVFLDLLGFGDSPKPDIDYTLADHLTAIRLTLQSLGLRAPHLVGHSMGCLLALAYADHFVGEVSRLVLLALPAFQSEQEARRIIANSSQFNRLLAMDTWLARLACTAMCHLRPLLMTVAPLLASDVPAVVARASLRHTWTSYSKTLRHVIFQTRAEEWLQDIRRPVLIIQGMSDTIAPIANVITLIDQQPNIRLLPLDAGHRLIFTHSATITNELVSFLQALA